MKVFPLAVMATMFLAGGSRAESPQVLLQQYKCYVCHADFEARTGPAYIDIAAKYRGKPDAVAIVAAMVRKGIHGNAPWHMPPHPEVSIGDAKTMARYILSLGK